MKNRFESEPIVSLFRPQSEILGKNTDSVEIKQIISIEFSPREEVEFDTSTIEKSDYNQGFKSLVYDISVENMQTGNITSFRTENSYLWVYVPSNIDC